MLQCPEGHQAISRRLKDAVEKQKAEKKAAAEEKKAAADAKKAAAAAKKEANHGRALTTRGIQGKTDPQKKADNLIKSKAYHQAKAMAEAQGKSPEECKEQASIHRICLPWCTPGFYFSLFCIFKFKYCVHLMVGARSSPHQDASMQRPQARKAYKEASEKLASERASTAD